MGERDNGGPAFPVPLNPGQSWQGMASCDGMTLRDYFAAKWLQGYIANPQSQDMSHKAAAEAAYRMADAMLAVRAAASISEEQKT